MALSGKAGTVKYDGTAGNEVTQWSENPSVNVDKYASNQTNLHKKAVGGTEDNTFTVTMKLNARQQINAGDEVEYELHVDDTSANYIKGNALVASVPLTCDIDNGAATEYTVTLEPTDRPVRYGQLYAGAEAASSSGY